MSDLTILPTVLVLDDEKNIRKAIEIALSDDQIHVVVAHDAAAAFRALNERIIDLVILDIKLGEIDGIAFYRKMQQDGFTIPTVFISGNATLTQAAEAIKIGAFDFLEKPFSAERISVVVKRCLEFSRLKERLRLIEAEHETVQIIGDSPLMRKVVGDAVKVARTTSSVLITGESGTGKELVANMIHARSERSQQPFVKVNCSAIPDNLIESELFGFVAGAFTGAATHKRGLFEVAHRGSIFLDEIADLSAASQAKLLRVLQSGEIQKIGSEKPVKVDVRVIAATHKDLKQMASQGVFREDLFYRVNVVPIHIPSLRERPEDIPLLARFFARRLCERNNFKEKPIDDAFLSVLIAYAWPGNVRELQNILERVIVMSGDTITSLDLPQEILADGEIPEGRKSGSTLRDFRDSAEREFILGMLKRNNGNISRSAIELGVGRTYLHKRLAVLGIARTEWFS
ncbi:MAG TPA: sigma-54 dependent transcriptional regulator [Steroidobacteraceae bacterium]